MAAAGNGFKVEAPTKIKMTNHADCLPDPAVNLKDMVGLELTVPGPEPRLKRI